MIPSHCQIAIVGGGPAGLVAAKAATDAGAESVVVLERKRRWGWPVQCAGYVPRLLGRYVPLGSSAIRSSLDSLRFHFGGSVLKRSAAPGYVLRREVFERTLAEEALRAGVRCVSAARVLEIRDGELGGEQDGKGFSLKADVIIGADGPRSLVRRAMGFPAQSLAFGMEYEFAAARSLESVAEIHFCELYGAGYAWIFPRRRTLAVGLAVDADRKNRLRELLDMFVEDLTPRTVASDARSRTVVAGAIPVGGADDRSVLGGMLLVGDAAGQTNPLTGAGVFNAVVCGRMAGCAAAKAVATGDAGTLEDYDREWRDLLEFSLKRSSEGRDRMAVTSGSAFAEAVRTAWRLGGRDFQK